MRAADSFAPNAEARGGSASTRDYLCDVVDTFVAMRWDLDNALYHAAAADVPEVAIERMQRVKSELDLAIAAWKTLLDKNGLSPPP